jgi:hypothetical protein
MEGDEKHHGLYRGVGNLNLKWVLASWKGRRKWRLAAGETPRKRNGNGNVC